MGLEDTLVGLEDTLVRMNNELVTYKNKIARLEGEIDGLKAQLKKFGYTSESDAKKSVEEMDKWITGAKRDLEVKVEELKRAYAWKTV